MINAVKQGSICLEKLEAMTTVCSVGLDMIAIPGDTPATTVSGIMADEFAIGMVNNKTTAVRLIPAPGKKAGDWVEFGGLLGGCPVLPVSKFGCADFINRGGRIPAPIASQAVLKFPKMTFILIKNFLNSATACLSWLTTNTGPQANLVQLPQQNGAKKLQTSQLPKSLRKS